MPQHSASTANKAIIVGASSGIGWALALRLKRDGFALGLMARRTDLLEKLQKELGAQTWIRTCDVSQEGSAMKALDELIKEMGGVELVVLNAGAGHVNPELAWELEREAIMVNSLGFAALATVAFNHFMQRRWGQLVGISSVAALAGSSDAPAYSASKAFASNYLDGLRSRAAKSGWPITVTDIKPGFVDTAMGKSRKRFWVAPTDKAAAQIADAIYRRVTHAYVTRRWRLIGWLMKIIPEPFLRKWI